ncbi:MAG: cytochrome-c peroxidase [Thiomargarita sp.]|nr:cytochrome-c peroxidase [Thiomargarita sp.]
MLFRVLICIILSLMQNVCAKEPITPIPLTMDLNPDKVALGQLLFEDKRLSHDNTIACVSCHDLAKGGTDQLSHSIGINDTEGDINAPTVFNSGFNFRQFWNGRAATLEEQVHGPIHHPKEMGSHWIEVINKLKKDQAYLKKFKALYPQGIQIQNIKEAIALYERSLFTPNARFDQYLRGNHKAISSDEKKGYTLFKQYGCIACHQGMNIGGNLYQVFGVLNNYFEQRGNITQADLGRFTVTGKEYDRYRFKVPSLRNVEITAPYFHDGSAKTLKEAVDIMAFHQLGRTIPEHEKQLIVIFLKTLTGTYQGVLLK